MSNKKINWKLIATIFIILFLAENIFITVGLIVIDKEERQTKECFYDICGTYPDAYFDESVCSCYDYGTLGDLVIVKEVYMK